MEPQHQYLKLNTYIGAAEETLLTALLGKGYQLSWHIGKGKWASSSWKGKKNFFGWVGIGGGEGEMSMGVN